MAKRPATSRVRKVDQVIADLQKKMGVSGRAPKNTKKPWLDEAVEPPVTRTYLNGWYTAEELRETATRIDPSTEAHDDRRSDSRPS
jgi:hypothetical protein